MMACFALAACSRWFGFQMDYLMFAFTAIACFAAVVANDLAWLSIDPNVLGLALIQLIQLSGLFQYGVRQSAEVVNQMVAVDRVLDYRNLPSEAALTTPYDDEVSKEWPQNGTIAVRGLNVRYSPGLPLSLRSLTFEIPGGSRVGVVGRTGCGKSTLIQSLIRLLEAEDGQIVIDSVDISKLGLSKLRRSIGVMPQCPVLYGGISLRDNLDPFHDHSDGEIHRALLYVSMLDAVESLPCGLNSIMTEGGSGFSAGQKQLLCLVRAILRKNKILVLDEPTANVDNQTDKLLQEAVAENFECATILAIAHRLDTVIYYDKILVLGSGGVLEYGSPDELIASGGAFSKMLDETAGMATSMLKANTTTQPN
ncbi:hypothetical protein ACHAXA_007699 [Cyclostephanos tholiformis]|uniref:ABC transporter domain-containing protein n=1 Tax=Cyclostephanos tholiformis TaxID=382380 RepID=A0ABD3RBI8_9STRA